MSTYVKFERGRDGVMGPVLGPFEWVQVTYLELRVPINEGNEIVALATYDEDKNDWVLGIASGDHEEEIYSDYIIFEADGDDVTVMTWPKYHDCPTARLTSEQLEEAFRKKQAMMKRKDLKSLLARAAAALETPGDLTPEEKNHVVEDLREAESKLEEEDNG